MPVVKEYYQTQIDMRGPGNMNAAPAITGSVCVLRHADGKPLTVKKLSSLFSAAAKDYPRLKPAQIRIQADRIEFSEKPRSGYKPLPPRTIAARG